MDCLEYKHGDFEDDSLFNWWPVQLFDDRCDVSEFPGQRDKSGRSVL